ncbi:hypothetical protein DMN91_007784 [Ooceraea biroi]|uniref:CRAL-TRIO domain-containing protein n=1 Tax=Ooceraea biroi TaxID=2015173 RepID=A0A3L8DFJ1_OOCBI|nr:hypothetical protein DMN91_007784 [Ooceraea biroi]
MTSHKNMISEAETDLKCPLENEAWLIRFLRPCKYYPESTRDRVKHYYNFKVKHANVYDNLKPSKERNIFEQNILTVLPNLDEHGRRILIIELGKKWKHNKCSLDEVYKGCVLYLEAAMLEPTSQITGAVIIFDMDGLSLQQTWQFTPPFAKRIVDLLQDVVALRIKNLHIVNQPYVFNMVFALFKPFLREKLKNRIIFHGTDRKSLHQYMSPKCLPACYGGTLGAVEVTAMDWYHLFIQMEKEYEGDHQFVRLQEEIICVADITAVEDRCLDFDYAGVRIENTAFPVRNVGLVFVTMNVDPFRSLVGTSLRILLT